MASEDLSNKSVEFSEADSKFLVETIEMVEDRVRSIEESLIKASDQLTLSIGAKLDSYFRNEEFIEFEEFSESEGDTRLTPIEKDEPIRFTEEAVRNLEATRSQLRQIKESIQDLVLSR